MTRLWYDRIVAKKPPGSPRGEKIRTAESVKLGAGPVGAFLDRSLHRARKLDRGEKLKREMRLTFEDPADLVKVLTAQRVRVLHAVRKRPAAVSDLAVVL